MAKSDFLIHQKSKIRIWGPKTICAYLYQATSFFSIFGSILNLVTSLESKRNVIRNKILVCIDFYQYFLIGRCLILFFANTLQTFHIIKKKIIFIFLNIDDLSKKHIYLLKLDHKCENSIADKKTNDF